MKANQFFYAFFAGCFFLTACKNGTPAVSNSEELTASSTSLWTSHDVDLPKDLNITSYNSYQLDTAKLKTILNKVTVKDPHESTVLLELPNPDSSYSNWKIAVTSTMSDELMAKFPELKTYQGVMEHHSQNTVRLEWTGQGFTAMLKVDGSECVIQPLPQSKTTYLCYLSKNISATKIFKEPSQPK